MKERKFLHFFQNLAIIFLGTGIYAFGIYAFTAPNQIAPGGVTGLATVINDFTGFPIGAMEMCIRDSDIIVNTAGFFKKFPCFHFVHICKPPAKMILFSF